MYILSCLYCPSCLYCICFLYCQHCLIICIVYTDILIQKHLHKLQIWPASYFESKFQNLALIFEPIVICQIQFWQKKKCSTGQTFVVQLVLIFPGFVVLWAHFATGNNWARQNRFVFIRQKPGQIYNKVPSSGKTIFPLFSPIAKIKMVFQRT